MCEGIIMVISDFVNNKKENIPEEFYKVLPTVCAEPNCTAPMLMTEVLTGVTCSNPFCPRKITHRIYLLLLDLGVDFVTEEQVHSYVIDHNIKNVFDVFLYDYIKDSNFAPTLSDADSKTLAQTLQQNNLFSVLEYIKLAHLPKMDLLFDTLFINCTDLVNFFDKLDEQGVAYLKAVLNDTEETFSIDLINIYRILLTHKDELLQGMSNVNLL